jgi:ubiquitin carboxyl-terminal hydrolase 14
MKDLFKSLEKSGQPVSPLVFLQTMRAKYPQFDQRDRQGYYSQQDAEECFSSLVTALDHTLVGSPAVAASSKSTESFVTKYMTGLMEQTMTCDDAPNEPPTKSIEKYYRLHCHISQSVNYLSQGLQEVIN